MLRQRIITALVLVALLLPTLFTDSSVPFSVFALMLAAAGLWEWGRLCGLRSTTALALALAFSAAAALCLNQGWVSLPAGLGWVWLTVVWVALCALLFPVGPRGWRETPLPLRLLLGLVVLMSTWWALTLARTAGVNFLLSTLCIVWASDVSAYFAGRRWGRRKLAPTISPGKSWEGVIGACAGVLILASLWMAVERSLGAASPSVFARALESFGVWGLVVTVTSFVALGVAGDLFESLLKRAVGIKDSSGLLPGHGGVLDRVDALLPVLPAAMAVLALGGR